MVPTIPAAGALVWRIRDKPLEVLLVHRPAYDDWSWPKGKARKRETLPACAVREVEEETGVRVRLGMPLPLVRDWLGDGSLKVNWYWAAHAHEAPALAARTPVTPAPLTEVDETRWVKLRTAWEGGELTRPLTGRGRRQAGSLVELFAAYGARQVTSSVWGRCLSTVEPFAEAESLEITALPELRRKGSRRIPGRYAGSSAPRSTPGTAPWCVPTGRFCPSWSRAHPNAPRNASSCSSCTPIPTCARVRCSSSMWRPDPDRGSSLRRSNTPLNDPAPVQRNRWRM